jgi:hypothetical protein
MLLENNFRQSRHCGGEHAGYLEVLKARRRVAILVNTRPLPRFRFWKRLQRRPIQAIEEMQLYVFVAEVLCT